MIIVFGNTKGGTGKSTLAFHMSVAFSYANYRVACLDCDCNQGTLTRFLDNRLFFQKKSQKIFPSIKRYPGISPQETLDNVRQQLQQYHDNYKKIEKKSDILVIDTPGQDSEFSRLCHRFADILITPINNSTIDLDLFVTMSDPLIPGKLPLSTYASLVWDERIRQAALGQPSMEWIVVRNRMHTLFSKNQLQINSIVESLSQRIGFSVAKGLTERTIFRELFPYGITVLDEQCVSLPYVNAKNEIMDLLLLVTTLHKKRMLNDKTPA